MTVKDKFKETKITALFAADGSDFAVFLRSTTGDRSCIPPQPHIPG